jgi:glucosamine-6-phosphate deaminase
MPSSCRMGSTGSASRPFTLTNTSGCRWAIRARSGTGWTSTSGRASDPAQESRRYGALLADGGIDLGLIGIGENGHLAFNDPHVADFDDPLTVKLVEIDDRSRHQQVHDGAFDAFEDVPRLALTVTMSAILSSRSLSVVVPGAQKAEAVARTLDGPIETACPASALRRHPDAVLFVDTQAFARARPSSREPEGSVR